MDYPFDINYDTDHPELSLWTPRPASDFAVYNSTTKTLDFTHQNNFNGILLLHNTPPVPTLTFGAEISFTENIPTSAVGNYFGFWGAVNPEVNYVGIVPYHRNDSQPTPSGNGWAIHTSNSAGTFVTSGTKVLDGTNGVPAFSAGTWYDFRMEYVTNILSTQGGYAVFRMFVNGVQFLERTFTDEMCLGITPGFYGYNSKYKVRRIYGSRATSFNFTIKTIMDGSVDTKWAGLESSVSTEGRVETFDAHKNYVYDEGLTIYGRLLDESFQPSQELIYAYETETMRPVTRTTSNSDGAYALEKLDAKYQYTVMVHRGGLMKTLPVADYVGYGELAGSYRIRGDNIGEVQVKVYSEQTGEYLGMVMTNINGQFSIPNVNKNHEFTLVFREPSGLWEDRVSSRRLPEIIGGSLSFVNTVATNSNANGVTGSIRIVGGRQPYTVNVTGLPDGMGYILSGDTVTFTGTSGTGGVYPVSVSAQSIDDYTGTVNFNVLIANSFGVNFVYEAGETAVATMDRITTAVSQNFATDPGAASSWADLYSDAGSLTTAWQSAGVWRATSNSYNDALILKPTPYAQEIDASVETTIVTASFGNSPYIGFFAIPETSANVAFTGLFSTSTDNILVVKSNAQTVPALASIMSNTTSFPTPRSGRHKYQMRLSPNGAAMKIELLIDDVVAMTYTPSALDVPATQNYRVGMYIRSSSHDVHSISVNSIR